MDALEQLNLAAPIADIYSEVEALLINHIARQLTANPETLINATSEWRLQMLARMGRLNSDTAKIISQKVKKVPDKVESVINSAISSVLKENSLEITDRLSENVRKALENYNRQAVKDKYNQVNTVMQYKAKQAYKNSVNAVADHFERMQQKALANSQEYLDVLNKQAMAVTLGETTRTQALRETIEEMSEKGIPAFVDAAGREWSPEAYVNMDIRNTVKNAALAAEFASLDELGQDIILVSSHAGARKKCAPYQGKFFSRSGKSGTIKDARGKEYTYTPLSDTSFGEPDGLIGINCGHRVRGVSSGMFIYREEQYSEDECSEEYKKVCKQRQMERRIRTHKRQKQALIEAGDTEGAKNIQKKITAENKALRAYCEQEGLTYRQDRTQIYGYSDPKRKKKPVDFVKTVDISAESGISETVKSAFVPAKNIKEAQEYAEKLGVKYADYSKFPLERANNMNMALSTLPDNATPLMVTDLQKYSKVTGAPLGRAQKNGYAVTASPYEINPSAVGSSDAKLEGSGETIIAVNTRNFKTLDSLTESKREYNEKYENLKGCRWHFNMEGKMTDFHECGHVYEKKYGLPTGFIADAERWRKETKLGLLKSDREAWAEAYGAYYTHRDDLPDYIRKYFDEGEVKTVSGSKVLSFEEWQKKIGISIDKTVKSDIMKTGKDLSKYVGAPIVEKDNLHVREWYYANVHNIPNIIDKNLPFEQQVMQAYDLRNKYKREARAAMIDLETLDRLENKRPIKSFDELLESKMKRKNMTREEALRDILETASKTNSEADDLFGL